MKLSSSASALGLYKYECSPEYGLFGRFYSAVINQLQLWGVAATYVGADGNGYSGKLTKVGSRTHDKLVKSNFANVSVLSITANPTESEQPSFDCFVSASLSYVKANRELLACIVVNESFAKIHSPKFEGLLQSQVELCRWDFGYGFSSSVEKQPDFHILGLDSGKLTAEEYKSLRTWYTANEDIRMTLIRDVYPYNILNEEQLNIQVSESDTLFQIATSQPGCTLKRLTDYGLHLWQVPDSEIPRLRNTLAGSPALVS